MKGKLRFSRNKMMATIVLLMSTSICFSSGFASWYSVGGDNGFSTGAFNADSFTFLDNPVSCIDSISFDGFSYCEKYGFVDANGAFVSSIDFTGSFVFNVSNAKTAIASLDNESKRFSMFISFTGTTISNISYGVPSLSSFGNDPVSVSSSGNSATYNITLTGDEYSSLTITRDFSVSMTYSGSLSSFPNLSSASYSISLVPGEYYSS